MAVSDFWHDLAAEFRALPGGSSLRGDWDYTANSGRPYQWRFAGANPATDVRFEALARRAASEMPNPKYSDALLSWLEAVRTNSHYPGTMDNYGEKNADGSEGPIHVLGSVQNLCEESAIYCNQLESDARQKEFEEKQRNDPRNWSEFHQMIEVAESFNDVRDAPAKRISEEFARKTIARIYGIPPEQVTDQIINFEITRLVPFYHNIQLIPSIPKQESPPAPDTKPGDQGEPKPAPESPSAETIAAQLQRLRVECDLTEEELAEEIGIDIRSVQRHLASDGIPRALTLRRYERAFSKLLNKQIVIRQMP
jgi:ribosome-binding protein aMBF1 (putative translation factor)